MPRDPRHLLYIGIYDSVLALDTRDGTEVWRAKLGGGSFVNVHWDGEELFTTTKGECFRLDPKTGAVIWNNKLKGLGHGVVTMVTTRQPNAGGNRASAAQVLASQRAATQSSA
jgi:outer membrane protein assembly factor BamB